MEITPTQLRWFRLRRSGLVEPFATPERTARRLLGVQSQLAPAAGLAFWNRTVRCQAESLEAERIERRRLVRFWGQRDTLHTYRAKDWPLLHAALAERLQLLQRKLERKGVRSEFSALARRTARRLSRCESLAYADVRSTELAKAHHPWVVAYVTFLWLVREGLACHGPERGNEASFVHRERWLQTLAWSPPEPERAGRELALRYLEGYGPAEPADLAFWFGASQANARRWLESARGRCATVSLGGRALWCRRTDLDELAERPPPPSRWPVRLLYRFDPLLLATKDKTAWIEPAHYKRVWRPAGHVEAVLLAGGRIAGTWRYDRTSRGLRVRVQPFARPSRPVARAAEEQARGVADFVGLELASFELARA